jgi:hypothetical protein
MVDSLARRGVLLLAALGFVEPSLARLQARRGGGRWPGSSTRGRGSAPSSSGCTLRAST